MIHPPFFYFLPFHSLSYGKLKLSIYKGEYFSEWFAMKELSQSRNFKKNRLRLIISFFILVSLISLKQFVVHYQVVQEENTSHMINIAGRQRMLSQKIVKELTFLQQGLSNQTDELEASVMQFEESQRELVAANEEVLVSDREHDLIIHMYEVIEPSFKALVQDVTRYLDEWEQASPNKVVLAEHFASVRAEEVIFLEQMNEIVFTYEEEAQKALQAIQNANLVLFGLILLAVVVLFIFVFLPLLNSSVGSYLQMRRIQQDLIHMLDNMKGILLLVDRTGKIVFTNEEAAVLLKVGKNEVSGQSIADVIEWLNFDMIEFIQQIERETDEDIEVLVESRQRKIVPLSLSAVAGHYNNEEIVLLALHDLTKQKNAEALLKKIAIRDELTGLYNRHVLENIIGKEFFQADRYQLPLSVTLLDIDNFKKINDQYGHPTGDAVLRLLAQTLLKNIRTSDYIVRIGGEEILIFLPNTSQAAAQKVAEKLRRILEQVEHPNIGQVTASFGVVERQPEEAYLDLYKRVDSVLYQAKQNGKNRVEVL